MPDEEQCALPEEPGALEIDILVDGNPVLTCTDYWRLNVRACGTASDPACHAGACGACGDGDIDRDCDLGDACGTPSLRLATAGTYTVCVEAELVNGGLAFETCADVTIGEEGPDPDAPLAIEIDTDRCRSTSRLLGERDEPHPLVVQGPPFSEVGRAGADENVGAAAVAKVAALGDDDDVAALAGVVAQPYL